MLEVSLLGVGTVLRLERDAWSMVKRPRQATNEYAPSPPRSFFAALVSCGPVSSLHRCRVPDFSLFLLLVAENDLKLRCGGNNTEQQMLVKVYIVGATLGRCDHMYRKM